MAKYDTNLASEFYVMSMLHRIGADAYLTLGNKKAVDIAVQRGEELVSIDVKGMLGSTSWPVDNCNLKKATHYLVLVAYKNQISNCNALPEVYVLPSLFLDSFSNTYANGSRKTINLSRMRREGQQFKNNWQVFLSVNEE